MTPKKKETSNTESSTASSTDSTTSSSSSSGSDSGSSSSDSDSSSSQDDSRPSQNKKPAARRSTDSAPAKSNTTKNEPDKQTNKSKPDKTPQKTPIKNKSVVYSSEEDLTTKTNKSTNATAKRKAPLAKPKSSTTVTPKPKPTILKSGEVINKQNPTRKITDKPNVHSSSSSAKNKKKSIFSPDNSSDSEDSALPSKPQTKNTSRTSAAARTKDKPVSKPKVLPAKTKPSPKAIAASKPNNTNKTPGRPRRNSSRQNSKSKGRESSVSSIASNSCSTSDSGCSSVSNDERNTQNNDCQSDSSESSAASIPVPPPSKKPARRSQLTKTQSSSSVVSSSKSSAKPVAGASESDDSKRASVTRKLTRSSSTRKSKHLTGKAPSDTESDGCDSGKRSASKSPVKRSSVGAKAPGKNKRPTTAPATGCKRKVSPPPEERKCPLDGCDSTGHLGGVYEKHFTIEACPIYHNTTMAQCKQQLPEWKKQEEERVKAIANLDKDKKGLTPEQRQYQLKIKEMRSKFKPTTECKGAIIDKEHEPSLAGVACEYDLKLFREAQALASVAIEDELKELPVSRGTRYVSMGKYCMEVWYQSPYPEDVARLPKLYLCEFCLRYQKSSVGMTRHAAKCVWRHPPGEEVYRKNRLGVWQVDGKRHKQYCQHLCLLAKFFLDHKTLYYDVEPFLFYVMTLTDSEGAHTVGYFSKEKNSFLNYNVSCILTLPPYQRQGYGRLLIDFSYLLTRTEGKIGSPEKPLSDLGLISYRSYWKDVLLAYLCSRDGTTLSVKDVSQEMAINSYDIVSTLQALGMMKYWKGKHIILKKLDVLEEYSERVKRRGSVREIDPACLRWSPFVPPANPGGSSGGGTTANSGNASGNATGGSANNAASGGAS